MTGDLPEAFLVRYQHDPKFAAIGEQRRLTEIIATPAPATHSILTAFKAGETVCQTIVFVLKHVFGTIFAGQRVLLDAFGLRG